MDEWEAPELFFDMHGHRQNTYQAAGGHAPPLHQQNRSRQKLTWVQCYIV